MKQLILTLPILLLLIGCSSTVTDEDKQTVQTNELKSRWTEVVESVSGDTHYVNFDRIKQHDGYVYYWGLRDNLKPDSDGDMSSKSYKQVDCDQFRYKELNLSVYSQPMGRGTLIRSINEPDKNWTYPPPNSVAEFTLKTVCNHVKSK